MTSLSKLSHQRSIFIVLFSFISSWQLFCTIYIFACILFFSDKVVPQGFYLSFEGLSLSFAILKYESRFFFMHYYLFFNFFFCFFSFFLFFDLRIKKEQVRLRVYSIKRWQKLVSSTRNHKQIAFCC